MLDINQLIRLSGAYKVPLEDALFIALNVNGVNFECDFNRMRTALQLVDSQLFKCAKQRCEMDYYFALPVNQKSPFAVIGDTIKLGNTVIGRVIGATEDVCDSHYPRRNGTSLNINPNSRTSCHGCEFCYTAYQVPCDRKKLRSESDLKYFFESWIKERCLPDLSHLIQISVVTGCYDCNEDLCRFLLTLKEVLSAYKFRGKIFYLGSQITTEEELRGLTTLQPFCVCYSLETFERRDLLRDKKRALNVQDILKLMGFAKKLGYETSFSYIVGIEPLDVMEKYFGYLLEYINKFPIVNTLQIHKYHKVSLVDPSAVRLEYFLEARKLIENIFSETNMRPLVWEN